MLRDHPLLATVVDHLPLGVWIARVPGGEFVFANRVFREIMGMEARSDVAAGGYAEPYGIFTRGGQPYPESQMPFARAVEARATVTVDDIVIHRRDGRKVNIRATARPVAGEGDTIAYVVIAFADVTAEVAAEDARRAAEERSGASQRLEALGTLAAGVAHDFNNLLASIRMLASLLALREPDPSRREDLQHIQDASESAAQLARSLLTFGRHGPARVVPVDVVALARGVVALVRRSFDKNIEFSFSAEAPAAEILADPSQIEQLLMNLLVNARDAMPSGGRIGVRVARVESRGPGDPLPAGSRVVIEVADSGPGVPPALRDRVFEPYFTTKQGGERPGSGLGLATVYGIVQAYGGDVEVLDAHPRGALFRVTLPIASAPASAGASRSGGEAPRPGRGTVLLVDDERPVRAAVARALDELGYRVREATDGETALEVTRAHRGELAAVLLDTVMPGLGGRETFTALREIAPGLPVLMTTGRATPEEIAALLALGVDGFLPKPFDLTALSRALGAVLERR